MSKTVEIRSLEEPHSIHVSIPLTATSGKARIKKRSCFREYGVTVPTRSDSLSQSCYLEWQIGYDATVGDLKKGLKKTTVPECRFTGANGKEKAIFELSEYIYHLAAWKVIPVQRLQQIEAEIKNIQPESLFDVNEALAIRRTHPLTKELCGIEFDFMRVEYPLLVHRYGKYEIITEIIVREQQRAAGIQPMLFLCIPVTELKSTPCLIGRTAQTNECADFVIDAGNAEVLLEVFRLFGRLSGNHRHDVLAILRAIIAALHRAVL